MVILAWAKLVAIRAVAFTDRNEAVVMIHGGMGREERRKAQEAFTQDIEVQVLIATDAAGEGINLQRAHLMVNYDCYGDAREVRDKLNQVVQDKLDQKRLRELLEERALARDSMDIAKVQQIREEMERAQARRLQPHFIASFFLEAFAQLGGTVRH